MSAPAIKRIHFEDNGQDFLWWDIDAAGSVVGCGPFQAWCWVGLEVALSTVRKGSCIATRRPGQPETEGRLKHRVSRVERPPFAKRETLS